MQNEKRIRHHIQELQDQWELLGKKLSELHYQRIVTANAQEKFHLKQDIAQIEQERQQIEQTLEQLENGLPQEQRKTELRQKGVTISELEYAMLYLQQKTDQNIGNKTTGTGSSYQNITARTTAKRAEDSKITGTEG